MRTYVFEITLRQEDLEGDEMWEDIMKNTSSEGTAELSEMLQLALRGECTLFAPDGDDEEKAKEAVKLKSFSSR